MKEYLKLIGAEIVYMLIVYAGVFVASETQFLGRKYIDHYSSFIFSGDMYRYNIVAYTAGLAIFAAILYVGYAFWLKKFIPRLAECNWWKKTIFCVVGLVLSFGELVILVLIYLFKLGLGDDMGPSIMFLITTIGWPVVTGIFIIVYCFFVARIRKDKDGVIAE